MARCLLAPLLALVLLGTALAQPKVVLDTDFTTVGDDGQALVMLAQLHAAGAIELLGVTVVSGNEWLDQEVAEALRAVERLGLHEAVPVHAGAALPLAGDAASVEAERRERGLTYAGAWDRPVPASPEDLVPPFDGFAREATLAQGHAADFIVEQVRAHPGEIDLLLLGPATNLALALRRAPDIADDLGRVIVMGGAFGVRGNVTPAAEFNVWFDPEAAREVVRAPLDLTFVPLDVTNTVRFTGATYERIVNDAVDATPVTAMMRDRFAAAHAADPRFEADVWDTLTLAALVDPSLVARSERVRVDVVATPGRDYGRTRAHRLFVPRGLQRATLVRAVDEEAFWDLYVDLMTRAVPVEGAAGR